MQGGAKLQIKNAIAPYHCHSTFILIVGVIIIYNENWFAPQDPLEVAGRKKGPLRMLLFGTHCQKLCASAKGTSEFGGYMSVRISRRF